MSWTPEEIDDLKGAIKLLENPSFVARVSNLVGVPVEFAFDKLPSGGREKLGKAVRESLLAALKTALKTMNPKRRRDPRTWTHLFATGVTGAAGGAFGLPALPVELPITTTIMLRSIADIARSEGENLSEPDAMLACLEVFALGGRSASDDAAESGYFSVRAALAKAVSEAAAYVAKRSVIEDSAPAIVRLLAQIASRFNVVVAEKIIAQGPAVIGGVGGAVVNMLFSDHFQDMARGHFTIRRLERKYGKADVESRYMELLGEGGAAKGADGAGAE